MKPFEIKLSWYQCELIANYYSFPATIFMLPLENMQKRMEGKKRKDAIHGQFIALRKIKEEIKELMK
jgi:hypothetical protein